jgi:alpha-L-fucosidase 2
MVWKNAKLVKLVIKSNLGGNLRLRMPNTMKLDSGIELKKATGKNPNSFYYVEETPAPVISGKATITPVELKETMLYDLPTIKGKTYTIVAR